MPFDECSESSRPAKIPRPLEASDLRSRASRPKAALSSSSDRDPLERLAAEFLDRRRRGENPSPSGYADQYPQWADQILEFFPALELMEGLKPGSRDQTASLPGAGRHRSRPPVAATRRVSHPPRDRPGGHGGGLRGSAGVARPTSRPEDPAACTAGLTRYRWSGSSSSRGRRPGCITRGSCRSMG